jgi:hypothetical protein
VPAVAHSSPEAQRRSGGCGGSSSLRDNSMTPNFFAKLSVAGLACMGFATSALANGTGSGNPGSLLVFPYFDNTRGDLTLVTVTNTSDDQVNGKVNVEFVYINGETCQEFNRTRTLTPDDEITVLTKNDNPNMHRGYVYVFAKSVTTGASIKFDHLIGSSLVLESGDEADYLYAPWTFSAGAALAEGAVTDLNNNHLHDLDGLEYDKAPNELLIPRFIGTGGPLNGEDEIVLINLTGGADFTAVIDLLVYNDNEEVFSAQFSFVCWDEVDVSDISSVFDNDFLVTTNHASNEVPGTTPLNFNETGWYRINGNTAFSTAVQFADPAILALQVETLNEQGGAMLPYSQGTQSNGSLLSHNLFGN